LKVRIVLAQPKSGWISFALSCAGILVGLLGLTLILAALSRDQDPRTYIGVLGVLLAPGLLIAGWRIGNRRLGPPEPIADPGWGLGKATPSKSDPDQGIWPRVLTISLPPDGRTVGKVGLGFIALLVAAFVALDVILTIAFRNLPGV
jgi:hypothetical protein